MGAKDKNGACAGKSKDKCPDKGKNKDPPPDPCDKEQAVLNKEPCPDQHTPAVCSLAKPEPRVPRKGEVVYDACPTKTNICPQPVDPCTLTDDQKDRMTPNCKKK